MLHRRALVLSACMLSAGTASAQRPPNGSAPAGFERPSAPSQNTGLDLDVLYERLDPRALQTAADRGIAWLIAHQEQNGGWIADAGHKQQDGYIVLKSALAQRAAGEAHMGITSFAGLALLAGGHLPGRGKHGREVESALRYVMDRAGDSGYLRDGGTNMYSHAFATLFLAQAYGMVRNPRLKSVLEHAVHWIVDNQNRYGGWRYNPFTTETDMSVTVCQLQALRAARNIGIEVPKGCIDKALAYVLRSRCQEEYYEGLFYYKIYGRGAYDKSREFSINAAAITALASAGNYDRSLWAPALEFVDRSYPNQARYYADHYYYWYGNYYACQAFFWAGGSAFHDYYQRLTDDVLRLQRADGSWHNDTGPGDVFATAVAALILQLPRQYLPIFQR